MIASTLVRDCLYLNWALERAAAPPLPAPLRYEVHQSEGREVIFASAVLFQHDGVHLRGLPFLRLSYPQLNLRFYVVDEDGMPSVFFRAFFVPMWALPASRALTGETSHWASLRFPRPERQPEVDAWTWKARRGERLEVKARRRAERPAQGIDLGSWEKTVAYFRQRPRGYLETRSQVKRIDTSHPSAEVWPIAAEVLRSELLDRYLPLPEGGWRDPHSAFLCPRIGMVFETLPVKEARLGSQVAATG